MITSENSYYTEEGLSFIELEILTPKTNGKLRLDIKQSDLDDELQGLFINSFIKPCKAEEEGLLLIGDELISINKHNIEGFSLEQLVEVIQQVDDPSKPYILLGIRRPAQKSIIESDNQFTSSALSLPQSESLLLADPEIDPETQLNMDNDTLNDDNYNYEDEFTGQNDSFDNPPEIQEHPSITEEQQEFLQPLVGEENVSFHSADYDIPGFSISDDEENNFSADIDGYSFHDSIIENIIQEHEKSNSLESDSNLQQSTIPTSSQSQSQSQQLQQLQSQSQSFSEDSINTPDIIQVILQKSDNGSLGLILNEELTVNPNTNQQTPHLYIIGFAPESRAGDVVSIGDELLYISGKLVEGKGIEEVIEILNEVKYKNKDEVDIVVRKTNRSFKDLKVYQKKSGKKKKKGKGSLNRGISSGEYSTGAIEDIQNIQLINEFNILSNPIRNEDLVSNNEQISHNDKHNIEIESKNQVQVEESLNKIIHDNINNKEIQNETLLKQKEMKFLELMNDIQNVFNDFYHESIENSINKIEEIRLTRLENLKQQTIIEFQQPTNQVELLSTNLKDKEEIQKEKIDTEDVKNYNKDQIIDDIKNISSLFCNNSILQVIQKIDELKLNIKTVIVNTTSSKTPLSLLPENLKPQSTIIQPTNQLNQQIQQETKTFEPNQLNLKEKNITPTIDKKLITSKAKLLEKVEAYFFVGTIMILAKENHSLWLKNKQDQLKIKSEVDLFHNDNKTENKDNIQNLEQEQEHKREREQQQQQQKEEEREKKINRENLIRSISSHIEDYSEQTITEVLSILSNLEIKSNESFSQSDKNETITPNQEVLISQESPRKILENIITNEILIQDNNNDHNNQNENNSNNSNNNNCNNEVIEENMSNLNEDQSYNIVNPDKLVNVSNQMSYLFNNFSELLVKQCVLEAHNAAITYLKSQPISSINNQQNQLDYIVDYDSGSESEESIDFNFTDEYSGYGINHHNGKSTLSNHLQTKTNQNHNHNQYTPLLFRQPSLEVLALRVVNEENVGNSQNTNKSVNLNKNNKNQNKSRGTIVYTMDDPHIKTPIIPKNDNKNVNINNSNTPQKEVHIQGENITKKLLINDKLDDFSLSNSSNTISISLEKLASRAESFRTKYFEFDNLKENEIINNSNDNNNKNNNDNNDNNNKKSKENFETIDLDNLLDIPQILPVNVTPLQITSPHLQIQKLQQEDQQQQQVSSTSSSFRQRSVSFDQLPTLDSISSYSHIGEELVGGESSTLSCMIEEMRKQTQQQTFDKLSIKNPNDLSNEKKPEEEEFLNTTTEWSEFFPEDSGRDPEPSSFDVSAYKAPLTQELPPISSSQQQPQQPQQPHYQLQLQLQSQPQPPSSTSFKINRPITPLTSPDRNINTRNQNDERKEENQLFTLPVMNSPIHKNRPSMTFNNNNNDNDNNNNSKSLIPSHSQQQHQVQPYQKEEQKESIYYTRPKPSLPHAVSVNSLLTSSIHTTVTTTAPIENINSKKEYISQMTPLKYAVSHYIYTNVIPTALFHVLISSSNKSKVNPSYETKKSINNESLKVNQNKLKTNNNNNNKIKETLIGPKIEFIENTIPRFVSVQCITEKEEKNEPKEILKIEPVIVKKEVKKPLFIIETQKPVIKESIKSPVKPPSPKKRDYSEEVFQEMMDWYTQTYAKDSSSPVKNKPLQKWITEEKKRRPFTPYIHPYNPPNHNQNILKKSSSNVSSNSKLNQRPKSAITLSTNQNQSPSSRVTYHLIHQPSNQEQRQQQQQQQQLQQQQRRSNSPTFEKAIVVIDHPNYIKKDSNVVKVKKNEKMNLGKLVESSSSPHLMVGNPARSYRKILKQQSKDKDNNNNNNNPNNNPNNKGLNEQNFQQDYNGIDQEFEEQIQEDLEKDEYFQVDEESRNVSPINIPNIMPPSLLSSPTITNPIKQPLSSYNKKSVQPIHVVATKYLDRNYHIFETLIEKTNNSLGIEIQSFPTNPQNQMQTQGQYQSQQNRTYPSSYNNPQFQQTYLTNNGNNNNNHNNHHNNQNHPRTNTYSSLTRQQKQSIQCLCCFRHEFEGDKSFTKPEMYTRCNGYVIQSINPVSNAARQNILKKSDEILEINGLNCCFNLSTNNGVLYEKIMERITKDRDDYVLLLIRRKRKKEERDLTIDENVS